MTTRQPSALHNPLFPVVNGANLIIIYLILYFNTVDCGILLKQSLASGSQLAYQMKPFHDRQMPSKIKYIHTRTLPSHTADS